MNRPTQPYPSGQHSLLRQHDARARQFLPFVRTRLTDLQRSLLVNALSSASALDNDGQNDPHGKGGVGYHVWCRTCAPYLRVAIDYLMNPMAKAQGAEANANALLAVAKIKTARRDKLREVYRESLDVAFRSRSSYRLRLSWAP